MVINVRAAVDLGASLAQALRYVNAWKSRTVVVKYGGSVMMSGVSSAGRDTVIEDLVLLKGAGVDPVLVHGGGPEITRMLERLGKTSRFVDGLRVTDEETMEVVEVVRAGRAKQMLVGVLAAGVDDRPLSTLRAGEARRLIGDGVISRGMIPKVEACLAALSAGVPTAHIIGAAQPHALLVELFTEQGVGTMITP